MIVFTVPAHIIPHWCIAMMRKLDCTMLRKLTLQNNLSPPNIDVLSVAAR